MSGLEESLRAISAALWCVVQHATVDPEEGDEQALELGLVLSGIRTCRLPLSSVAAHHRYTTIRR